MIKFADLESLFRIEKTENEKQILHRDLERQLSQRNYFIIIIVLFIVIIVSLTIRYYEKKKLNDALKNANISKDKFFRIIAHDLRAPFNATFSAVELLKTSYNDLNEGERKDTINSIGKLIKNNFDLMENLLMWSKNQGNIIEFDPVNLNLSKIINNNISLFNNNINKKEITLTLDCLEDLQINADEQMLNSILRNLIFNSIKFTNAGGKIHISAKQIEQGIQIQISDNGTGMNEETISGLFNLVNKQTLKGTIGESGSGIGLILTKEFIDKHGGTITVESKINEGSRFTIIFPTRN